MTTEWKEISVFISSTFRDMQAERDWLVKRVFPALRQRLESHRIYLVDIDLRWGLALSDVTEANLRFARITELCLGHINPGQPFFLCLLGGRYGTVAETAAIPPDSPVAWARDCHDCSITELEILHGVLNVPESKDHAYFYFRDPAVLNTIPESQLPAYKDVDSQLQQRGENLKARLSDPAKGYHVSSYSARWDPDAYDPASKSHGRISGLDTFGKKVLEDLWTGIRREHHLPDIGASQSTDHMVPTDFEKLEEERDLHQRFIENRTRFYIGRHQLQDDLERFTLEGSERACLVTGPPGSGKSAALSKLAVTWQARYPDDIVIAHFIGASPRSTSLRGMLSHLCGGLKQALGLDDVIKQNQRELFGQLLDFLWQVPEDRRVLIVIDALDQLDETDNSHSLEWLPQHLPPSIRLFVSCIDDTGGTEGTVLPAMRRRAPFEIRVDLLSDMERIGIVRQIPSVAAKTLEEHQMRLLLENEATRNPLYLLIALEELRGVGSIKELDVRIADLPSTGDTLTSIFQQVIRRLCGDFSPQTVRDILTLIACSRNGLSEREMLDILEGPDVQTDESAGDLFPILRQLRPYLQYRGPLLDFYHRHLARATHVEFFAMDEDGAASTHHRLASYFHDLADPKGNEKWTGTSSHAFSDLPYHLILSGDLPATIATLENIFFIAAKISCGMTYQLVEDFNFLFGRWPENDPRLAMLTLLRKVLRRHIYFIARHAEDYSIATFQCLWNAFKPEETAAPDSAEETTQEERVICSGRFSSLMESYRQERISEGSRKCWMRLVTPPKIHATSRQIAVLHCHERSVPGISYSRDRMLLATSGSGTDCMVRVWNTETGVERWRFSTGEYCASLIALSHDATFLVGATENAVRVWNVRDGRELAAFDMHLRGGNTFALSPDSRFLAIAGKKGEMCVWETAGWSKVRVCTEFTDEITCFSFSADGSFLVAGSYDGSISLWSTAGWKKIGRYMRQLDDWGAHEVYNWVSRVDHLCLSSDGRWIAGVFGSAIFVWDTLDESQLPSLRWYGDLIRSVAFFQDDRKLLIVTKSGTILVWEMGGSKESCVLENSRSHFDSMALSADGRQLATGGREGVVSLWDLEACGSEVETEEVEVEEMDVDIETVILSPDGTRAALWRYGQTKIEIWNTVNGTKIDDLINDPPREDFSITSKAEVKGMAFLPEGTHGLSPHWIGDSRGSVMVTGSSDGTIRLWSRSSFSSREAWIGPEYRHWIDTLKIDFIALSPDGKLLATAASYRVAIWNLRERVIVCQIWVGYELKKNMTFSPGGQFLSTTYGADARIWRVADGEPIMEIKGAAEAAAFSPDGKHAAFRMSHRGIEVRKVPGGGLVAKLVGEKYFGRSIAFSADGSRVLCGENDHAPSIQEGAVLRIWNSRTGALLETIRGSGDVSAITKDFPLRAMSRDGELVVEDNVTGRPVAFFPDALDLIATHPDGRRWVGTVRDRLVMVKLEGAP